MDAEQLAKNPEAWIRLQRMDLFTILIPNFAHDIVQPLTSICNFTSGLLFKLNVHPLQGEELMQNLTSINKEAFRASAIARDLRNLAVLNEEEASSVNFGDAIQRSLRVLERYVRNEQVSVCTSLADSSMHVAISSERLEQLIVNLIKNGVEAMRDLPSKERVLDVICKRVTGAIQFVVKDQGPPISQEVFDSLTRPFFSTKPSALGLGLWATKTIAEQNKGNLLFRRCPVRGLEAIVQLPIAGNLQK